MTELVVHLMEHADDYGLGLLGWVAAIYGVLIATRELMYLARYGAALTQTKRDDQIVASIIAGLDVAINFVDGLRDKLDSFIGRKPKAPGK